MSDIYSGKELLKTAEDNGFDLEAEFLLDHTPTIDAVPVIRCRECKNWEKGEFQAGDDAMHLEYGGYCPNSRFARYESDFCSYGERKEGADDAV